MIKIITLAILSLLLIGSGILPSMNISTKSVDIEPLERSYSHTILGEFGTIIAIVYCKYAHKALRYLFFNRSDDYPFYYVTHVYDRNIHAYNRVKKELGLTTSPTVFWDGGWRRDVGSPDIPTAIAKYKKSINRCANRTVADIDLSANTIWLGAVNSAPHNGAINVPINQTLKWTNTEMTVNITVTNNGTSQYKGHLHVYICENESSMGWYDYDDRPYTMAFLDYAFNENILLGSGNTWNGSENWDGIDHDNGTHIFDKVTEDNTWVIASIFDRDNYYYADETTGIRVGIGTDPKTFTVYFGDKTPPPLVKSNITTLSYDPGTLDWNTTYFWKVDVWNNKSEKTKGKIWNFTTRGNNPPNIPNNPFPSNGSINDTICPKNFSWSGGDPDGDKVFYDLYFGEYTEPLELLAENLTNSWYQDSHLLEFETYYIWKIVARDEYGLESQGPSWIFTTQENPPPYPPTSPYPKDDETGIPINVTLCWVGGDPNPCDTVTYDVYFGITYPPSKSVSNQTENCYNPADLELYQTYYWQIVAWDSKGLRTSGPLWNFFTGYPIPPDVKIVNPKKEYFHFSGIPLFPTPLKLFAQTISIGGFRLKPIQVNGKDVDTQPGKLLVTLFINDENYSYGRWNPKSECYEWQWTGWAFGTYILKVRAKDIYGLVSDWDTIEVWNFCFMP